VIESGRSLKKSGVLTKRDLQAALVATEIVWSSNFYGAAFDWEIVTGWDDATAGRARDAGMAATRWRRPLRGLRTGRWRSAKECPPMVATDRFCEEIEMGDARVG
jgi:hypothetical protein